MRNSFVVLSSKTLLGFFAALTLSTTCTLAAGYKDAVMADGPVAYWRFNDALPTAVNSGSLGAAANGTYNGDAAPGSQAPLPPAFIGFEANNTAAQFDGAGDFVGTVGNLMNSRPVFTVSGWMRRNGTQNARTGLWGQNDLVEFGYIANQTLEVWTDNGLDIANAIPDGQWAHLAIVSDGNPGTMFMYTNGVLAGQRAHSLPANNTFQFNIGGGGVFDDGVGNGNFFNGQIDEVAVYDKALNASQIAAQYAGAFSPITPLPSFAQLGRNKTGSSTNSSAGDFTIVGGGNDIWDNVDEFTYQYTEVTGDFDVQVRVESLTPSAQWSKAGIMVRENLAEDSRMLFPRVTPLAVPTGSGGNGDNNTRFAYRTGRPESTTTFGDDHNGGRHEDIDAGNTIGAANMPNGWLRLVRSGNVFHMSNSLDGIAWQFVGTQDTAAGDWAFGTNNPGPFAKTVLVGLGVSRHPNASSNATAQFRNFALTLGSPGSFNVIEASSRGNPNGVRISFDSPPGAGAGTPANYTLGVVSGPNVTVPVTGVRFVTGNDAPERDPMTFTLEGTTGDTATGPWTLIASGNTGFAVDPGRNVAGPIVNFPNAAGYRSYRVLFPTVRNAGTANSMQIAEIDLLDAGGNDITAPADAVVGVVAVAGNNLSSIAVGGALAGQNSYPDAEPPAEAIDNIGESPTPLGGAKYLNFAKLNTGIIVTPGSAALPPEPTVIAAAVGANPSTVQLTPSSPLVEGVTYIVTVANVVGADGSALNNPTTTFTHGAGYEARRIRLARNMYFSDQIAPYQEFLAYTMDIPNNAQDLPAIQSNTLFEDNTPVSGDGQEENYSMRISGLYIAPLTGNYTFYMSSDDNGRLYLSSDSNPANKVEIAREPAWNGSREYIQGANQATRGTPPANISGPIPLVAGGIYYLEEIHTEGGGGNFGSATVRIPNGPAVANGTLPIGEASFNPSRQFGGFIFSALGPVQIKSQPTNTSVTALTPATFRVAVDGTPRYTFQWRRNGQPIPGANASIYTIPATQLGDDGSRYSVVVANEFSSVTSAEATLSVLNPVPPHLLGATASSFTSVRALFDNRVEAASSQNVANYGITNAAGTVVAISSAVRDATTRGVVLTTATPLDPDSTYTLTVANVRDETGTTVLEPSPTNATFTTLAFVAGSVMRELYPQFSGTAVDALVTAVRAGSVAPTKACLTNIYEYNDGDIGLQGTPSGGENYGGRIFGYFVPTTSGNHVFYIATDDPGRLFLSTDSNPANVREIAREPVWSGRRTFTGEAGGGGRVGVPSASGGPQANISGPINLVAGERYYIESFFTEGGGGDNMAVAVQGPGDPVPTTPISAANLGVAFQAGTLAITAQPQSQTNQENGFATFSVTVTSSSALCGGPSIQWYSNSIPVDGATGPTLTVGPLSLSANGAIFHAVITAPERSVTSSNAVLGVVTDNVPPVLLSATADGTFTNINVIWNEIMAQGPAIDSGNYLLREQPGGTQIFVNSVDYFGDRYILRLQSPLVSGGVYSLELDYQTDLIGNPTALVGAPEVDTISGIVTNVNAWVSGCGGMLWESFPTGGGNTIAGLTGHPSFPNSPDGSRVMNSFDTRAELGTDNFREGFGARMRGVFVPPVSGNWVFYLHSDDAGQVFLNTNGAVEAGKTLILDEQGCCRDWPQVASAPIPLSSGRAYYIEGLYKEGTGGDYIRVAARLQGSSDPLTAISGTQLGSVAPAGSAGTVTISQQPTNRTVAQNSSVTFTAAAQTTFPIPGLVCYQWQRFDGAGYTNIPGATTSSYTLNPATLADDQAVFRVLASIVGATAISSNAVLTIVPDTARPSLVSARADQTFNRVRLLWSEVMDQTPAVDPGNYILRDSGMNQITVTSVDYAGSNVTLNLQSPLAQAGAYSLEIDFQADLVGNRSLPVGSSTIDPTGGILTNVLGWVTSRGFVLKELYLGLSPTTVAISELRSSPKYPDSPDIVRHGNTLELNTFDEFEGYGARMRGWLAPPVSGNYNFFMSADDNAELWLSTDASPANIVLIASEPEWNGRRDWLGTDRRNAAAPQNRSSTLFPGGIPLVAGQLYYFEALVKEGGGGDNLAVAWQLPGGPLPANGSAPIDGKDLVAIADPFGASITITSQPPPLTLFNPVATGTPLASVDFNANNGGFTVSTPQAYDGPWTYSAATGSWRQDGQNADNGHPNTSLLESPAVPITVAGQVGLSFVHRYSFEQDSVSWDGGQVRISVNGGPFTAVPGSAFTANGYNGIVGGSSQSQSALNGQQAFVGTVPGYTNGASGDNGFITTIAGLGNFNAGDTVRVQFMAANDTNTRGNIVPNWEIDSAALTQGGQLNVNLNVGAAISLASGVSSVVTYQWQRNEGGVWKDVQRPGADTQSLTFRPAYGTVYDYRVLVCVPGAAATSSSATVVGLIAFPWIGAPQVLQRSTQIPGGWTDIPGAANPYIIDPRTPPSAGAPMLPQEFFRQKP